MFTTTSQLELRAYSNDDGVGNPTTRKFIPGFYIFVREHDLLKKRSKPVLFSSTESKYRAMSTTTKEIIHLIQLHRDMGAHL